MTYLQDKSLERAELANRWRRQKRLEVGDRVLLRDRRHQRAGGRTAHKKPLTDPYVIKSIHGNKATVTAPDGTELHDIHFEEMLPEPDGARALEPREQQ